MWVTTTVMSESQPNNAFVPGQDGISDKVLDRTGVNVTSASARLKAVSTQASVAIETWNRARISGSARVTTDESASTMPTERPSRAVGLFAFVGRP